MEEGAVWKVSQRVVLRKTSSSLLTRALVGDILEGGDPSSFWSANEQK